MFLSAVAKNEMLEGLDESQTGGAKFGSLHTAYSQTGLNELSGGSPTYARKGLTWNPASSGSKSLGSTLPTWDVPPATTVAWIGLWDLVTGGNFLGMAAAGAGAYKRFAVNAADVTADLIDAPAHGFSAGQQVVVWGPALPSPLVLGTIYFVLAAGLTSDVLALSLTSGGSAINLTANGAGSLQLIVPEVFSGQGQYALNTGSIDLGALV